jgi:lipoprotein-anchoring transpeptidase ErfK/SrfK
MTIQEKPMKLPSHYSVCCIMLLLASACGPAQNQPNNNAASSPVAAASPIHSPAPGTNTTQPVTLPVLDAFFADQTFPELLRSRLQLTDDQIAKLKELAHLETSKLNEATAGQSEGETADARDAAQEKVSALIGADKADQLAALVRERWNDGSAAPGATPAEKSTEPKTNPMTAEEFAALAPNTVPTDSRIIVNTPAFRMDVFDKGRLIKSYKVGIGYPQFPLPNALRKASTIIFNPTWTPPDEPWVAKMKNVAVGQVVEAGSDLNPLGPIKIPIGQPSLIHGGKSPAKIGTFASHGCVGLTTPQVRDFAKILAQIGGSELTDAGLARYARDKTHTKSMKLSHEVPVELRYETIVVEDGKLHIYRDVYDQDSNTEEKLRAVLDVYGVKLEDLSTEEQNQVYDALSQLAGKSTKKIARPASLSSTSSPAPSPSPSLSPEPSPAGKKAVAAKNAPKKKYGREVVIEIAGLSGKGYPAPVALDNGSGRPARPTVATTAKPTTQP